MAIEYSCMEGKHRRTTSFTTRVAAAQKSKARNVLPKLFTVSQLNAKMQEWFVFLGERPLTKCEIFADGNLSSAASKE